MMVKLSFEDAMDLFIRTGYCGCNSEFFETYVVRGTQTKLTTCRICKKEHDRCYT